MHNLGIVFFLKEFESANKLKRILVSKKLRFKEIAIMPRGYTKDKRSNF